MKYLVKSTHRWSGITSDEREVQATSKRRAVWQFVQSFGSLGMLNYIKRLDDRWDGASVFEVMGTSGAVFDVAVRAVR